MAEDGFKTLRVKETSRTEFDRLRARLERLGDRVPQPMRDAAEGLEVLSNGAVFAIGVALAHAQLDAIEGRPKGTKT